MHDIKFIRSYPEEFEKLMRRRGLNIKSSFILEIDTSIRGYQTEIQTIQQKRNIASKEIGKLLSIGSNVSSLKLNLESYKSDLSQLDDKIKKLSKDLNDILKELPNCLDEDVPDGETEFQNEFVKDWGSKPEFSFKPRDHVEIGEILNELDFKTGVKISGSRFVLLRGQLALLERALSSFMLDTHLSEFDFEEVSPPYIVREDALFGTGQLPKFSEDLFNTTDNRWLIPTAEVPLTNIHKDEILELSDIPKYYLANSACFRREAGSYGKDTRGLLRVHQFNKVELVKFVHPDSSYEELESLKNQAIKLLDLLELDYRIIELCTGDLGFSAAKCFDLEVWAPGEEKWLEVSSCSNFEDFQSRRGNIRFRDESGKLDYVHTLNGSGLATPRIFAALLETHQNQDGSITIPVALQPYLGLAEIR